MFLTLVAVAFSQSAQMSGSDIEKRCDVLERKDVKEVGIPDNELFIPPLRRFAVQIHVSIIDCGIYRFGRVHHNISEIKIGIHNFFDR